MLFLDGHPGYPHRRMVAFLGDLREQRPAGAGMGCHGDDQRGTLWRFVVISWWFGDLLKIYTSLYRYMEL